MSVIEERPRLRGTTPSGPDRRDKNPAAVKIVDKWLEGHRAISKQRRDFRLNTSYYHDDQWVWWDDTRDIVQALAPRVYDNERVRLTINRIQPNLVALMSKLLKRELGFEVLPTAVSDDVMSGARLAEFVLRAAHADMRWEEVREENLLNVFLGAAAAIAVEWDPKGRDLERDKANGQIKGGEAKLTPLSIAEFTLEPGSRRWREARWWMSAGALPPEQVKDHYNLDWTPSGDSDGESSPAKGPMFRADSDGDTSTQFATVYCYYERPNQATPKGKVCHVVDDQVVFEEDWPFPFDHLNLAIFRQQKVPQRWYGNTLVNAARPIQTAYNHARSNMAEHMKLAGNARLAVPDTTMDIVDDLTDEAGEIIPYDAQAGPPSYISPPNLPRWLVQEADNLKSELDDVMSVHDVSRGVSPANDSSGIALSLLAEKDDTPLGLMAKDQAQGWALIATMVLKFYEQEVTETRSAHVDVGAGTPVSRKWDGKDLHGQTRVTVPLDTVLPHSRVAMQAWITNLVDRGMLPKNPEFVGRLLDLPGTNMIQEALDVDASQATQENGWMGTGMVILPEKFEDHARHMAEHNRFRKSNAYRFGDEETRQLVDLHIAAHEKMIAEEAAQQLALNAVQPGLAAMPQANEPFGSAVPPDFAERQDAAAPGTGAGPPPGMS